MIVYFTLKRCRNFRKISIKFWQVPLKQLLHYRYFQVRKGDPKNDKIKVYRSNWEGIVVRNYGDNRIGWASINSFEKSLILIKYLHKSSQD